jgi:hypothetical protein
MSTFKLEPIYQSSVHSPITPNNEAIPLVPVSPSSKWKNILFWVGNILVFLGFASGLIVLMYLSGKGKN